MLKVNIKWQEVYGECMSRWDVFKMYDKKPILTKVVGDAQSTELRKILQMCVYLWGENRWITIVSYQSMCRLVVDCHLRLGYKTYVSQVSTQTAFSWAVRHPALNCTWSPWLSRKRWEISENISSSFEQVLTSFWQNLMQILCSNISIMLNAMLIWYTFPFHVRLWRVEVN